MKEFDNLVKVISQLREECPWDKEQTHESLSKHLIEEAYELLDSLAELTEEEESYRNLNQELGDLLLQILLHSKIASEEGYFSIVEVIESLNEKLIKRHPHVFGDVELETPKDVEKQWEKIKIIFGNNKIIFIFQTAITFQPRRVRRRYGMFWKALLALFQMVYLDSS